MMASIITLNIEQHVRLTNENSSNCLLSHQANKNKEMEHGVFWCVRYDHSKGI